MASKLNTVAIYIVMMFIFMIACDRIDIPEAIYDHPNQEALANILDDQLGKPYLWGAEGPDTFDCSGLVFYSYARMNMIVPRVSREQANFGLPVSCNQLEYGDLLFFNTTEKPSDRITHVGIYIGNEEFEQASSRKGEVVITSTNTSFYQERLKRCRRFLPQV